ASTTTIFDAMDRVQATLAPPDTAGGPERRTTYTYDHVGNVLSITEPNGNLTPADPRDFVTRYTYDSLYRTRSVVAAPGHETRYERDDVGDITRIAARRKVVGPPPNASAVRYEFALNHRVTKAVDAAGNPSTAEYDHDGNTTATVDEDGNRTFLSYDRRGLLVEMRAPHDTVGGAVTYRTTRYEYDQVGNRTKVVSPRGVATPEPNDFADITVYDELNRVKEQIYPYDPADPVYNAPDRAINTYDEVGNLVKVSLPPSGRFPGVPGVRVDT